MKGVVKVPNAERQHDAEASPPPVTAYYDGRCPVCSREIEQLKPKSDLIFVDIHAGEQLPKSRDELLAELHVITGQGTLTGFDANLYIWRASGYEKRANFFAAPIVYPIARAAYDQWAKWRYRRLYRALAEDKGSL